MKKSMLRVIAMVSMLAPAGLALAEESGWSYKITPYLWAMGVDGDIGVRNVTVPVDLKFSDAVKDLELGGMIAAEAEKNDWIVAADASYINLDGDNDTQFGTFRAELEQWIVNGVVGYKIVKEPKLSLDAGAGFRYIGTDIDLNVPSDRADLSQSKDWADPVLAMRMRAQFAENCFGFLVGDIGGFGVNSDLTAQVTAGAGYSFNETYSMLLGYRYLYYDYDKDDFTYDAVTSGLAIGLQINL